MENKGDKVTTLTEYISHECHLPESLVDFIIIRNRLGSLRLDKATYDHFVDSMKNFVTVNVYRIKDDKLILNHGYIDLTFYKQSHRYNDTKRYFYYCKSSDEWTRILVPEQEGYVSRNTLWLSERDDPKAVHLLAQSLLAKIEDTKARLNRLETTMDMVLDWPPKEEENGAHLLC